MFGQHGRGGGGPWQGDGNNGMDPETLAQTLVNVAQNLLSSQSSQSQNVDPSRGHGGAGAGRPSPWAHTDEYHAMARSGPWVRSDENPQFMSDGTKKQKPMMGMGLLGPPPDGDYRSVRDPVFVIRDQGKEGEHHGFGVGEELFRENISRGKTTEKSRKNYRPKIKEDGCPPNYVVEEFDHLDQKYFCCDMCDKSMWNCLSFVNHIKGNAHNKVVGEVASKELAKVEEVKNKIAELVNLDKSKPQSGKCNMCGVRVKGDMAKHRKEDYHQQLKMFIHPHCKVCDADFEDRSEWHYHKFSSEHLYNLSGSQYGLSYDPMDSKQLEKILKELQRRIDGSSKKGMKITEKNNLFKEIKASQQSPKNMKKSGNENKNRIKLKDNNKNIKKVEEDIIIVEDDEVTEADLEPIMQDADNILGAEFIKPVNGLFCKLCKKFFMSGDSAITQHCKTEQHLQHFRAQSQAQSATKRSSAAEFFSPKRKK